MYDQTGTQIIIDWPNKINDSTYIGFDGEENFIVTTKTGIKIFLKRTKKS
jgi:hypothetical protein